MTTTTATRTAPPTHRATRRQAGPYLTRLTLGTRNRAAYLDLYDRTHLHHRLQTLTPDPHTTQTRLLYRLEAHPDAPLLLVQTPQPPDPARLPAGYAASIETRPLGELLDWIAPGRALRYRIDANPSHHENPPDHPAGAPRPHNYTPRHASNAEEALAWWHRQAERAGLTLTTTLDTRQDAVFASRKGAADLRLPTVRFEGTATVTDPDALRTAITRGIGQGKAFGLGLLSIAPHR
ncbi:type I-E CRISPR-associated protein Cas6/Cse3/CasE [Kitasatospora sp. NPDC101235]|uniref:type I-E CRISPR-associated protein Cas6/Cse3/CasE n=1 Tax=Kitasatospora sp. NPDC101235 TaxID=3364101 RepID=UPI00381368E7